MRTYRMWGVVLAVACGTAWATTNHTITVDGNLADWHADEDFAGNDGCTYYITWDANYVYVGAYNIDTAGDDFSLAFYMDDQVGTTNTANSTNFASAVAPSYYVTLENSTNLWTAVGTSGSWTGWTNQSGSWSNYAGWSGNKVSEIAIPRSFLNHTGVAGEWGVCFMGENDSSTWTWGTSPTANPTGGGVPNTMSWIYYWGDMASGVTVDSAATTNAPTDVECWSLY